MTAAVTSRPAQGFEGVTRRKLLRRSLLLPGLAVIPIFVTIVGLLGRPYVPIGDEASMLFRIQQVGTSSSPLVGVYSTRGWAHPGPILYYLLAIPYRLSGGQAISVFVAAAFANIACVGLICYLAWRRRGWPGLLIFSTITAILLNGLHAERLLQIWNPYLPLLPYLAFCLTLWCIVERDYAMAPLAVLLGSLVVQMHVGYVPLVLGGGVAVAVWIAVSPRSRREPQSVPGRRWRRVSYLLFGLMWLPPLIDVVAGGDNLKQLAKYFSAGHQDVSGLSYGLGLLSGHVKLTGPWSGGHELSAFTTVLPERLIYLLGLVLLLIAVAVLNLVKRRDGAGAPIVALSQLAAGAFAAARLQPPFMSYLIVWMFPLAAFCWAAVAMSAFDLLDTESLKARRWLRSPALAAALVAVIGVETIRTTQHAWRPPLPSQEYAQQVSAMIPLLTSRVERKKAVRIEGVGDDFNEAWVGALYGLASQDQTFYTSDGAAGQKWGSQHRWTGQPVDYTITIATSYPNSFTDGVALCGRDPSETPIAGLDQLSASDRQQLHELFIANYNAKGHLAPALAKRLAQLEAKGFRIVAFKGPHVCGA